MSIPYGIGVAVRTKPRVRVLNKDRRNTTEGDVFDARVTSGVTIYSGQIISLHPTDQTWRLGCPVDQEPFVALQDSTDSSVINGTLSALSCASGATIETAYFTGVTGTFLLGGLVGIDPALVATAPGASLRAVEEGDVIVGQVRLAGTLDKKDVNTETTAANAVVVRIRLGNAAGVVPTT